ncbi:hypothetical protein U3A55_11830 [Salarchaeum sp. III]|uniref:hypothetical protein n=1 Tax=Salarchaeum sp. III TaxID=3107927 RepID=UPI002ED81041
MLDALPGIEYWGARRIDDAISKDAVGGALLGVLLGAPLTRIPTFAAQVARGDYGLVGAQLAWLLGWLVSAYLSLLAIAHWKQLDDNSEDT